jgi:hypothetical protein
MRIHVLAAATLLAASSSLHAATDDPFVVHEWGTFTTVQGGDGEQISWMPPTSVDLPEFVYRAEVSGNWSSKAAYIPKDVTAFVRMETPVIYFYSERARVADVRVLFQGGNLTEWYPQGTRVESLATRSKPAAPHTRQFLIEWNRIKILARDTQEMSLAKLIRDPQAGHGDHYYVARETDANFLRVASLDARTPIEFERDLFYRGLGYFQAPLNVSMDSTGLLSLTARAAERISGMFVIEIRGDTMRYQKLGLAASGAASTVGPNTQPFEPLGDVRKRAMQDMAAELVQQGLYEKEARAMVNTWQDQWYAEEGTRVLYLLPRPWTDRTLQLQVTPQPDSVVRVMVGRAELITPTVDQELRKQILTFRTGDEKAKAQAVDGVRALRLGRFLNAAMTTITRGETNEQVFKSAWELAGAASAQKVASAREDERSARN